MITAAGACSSSDATAPALVATSISKSATVDSQIAVVGQPTGNVISVVVEAQNGVPLAGTTVTWSVMTGGGTLSYATSTTDANGVATTGWTMGTIAGMNTLQASIAGGATAEITATAVAGPPAVLNIMSGNNQTVARDSTTNALVVVAADQYGNMISGLNVTWMTSAGTLGTSSDATDATGEATDVLTTDDTTQSYVITATAGGLSATFTVTTQ